MLIITDRTELDEQIEKVFSGVEEDIYRTKSGADLVNVLNQNEEWLICSLIHKFGASEEGDIDAYLKDIESHLPKGFHAKGDIFVFVDECHRTQSGKLHEVMKAILPGHGRSGSTWNLPRNRQRAWSTSWYTRWSIYWSVTTMIVSGRTWTSSCRNGVYTGRN